MPKFDDSRLLALNGESGFQDAGMRLALLRALQAGETARAGYSVSAHIWIAAVLTDRALLLVKGAVRAKVTRLPLPLDVTREPGGAKQGVRLSTPMGTKTLWGSKLDPKMTQLLASAARSDGAEPARLAALAAWDAPVQKPQMPRSFSSADAPRQAGTDRDHPEWPAQLSRRERAEARRGAGKKPRKPRPKKARRGWVGFAPSSTIWDVSYNCVKCGRALTNPNSQRHRVGTDCIKRVGSQARKVQNPAYTEWAGRKARAGVDRIAHQVAFDAEYARSKAAYDESLASWRLARSGRALLGQVRPS